MIKKKSAIFVTLPDGKLKGLYELCEIRERRPSNDNEGGNLCKCCGGHLAAVFDVMQLGFWDNTYVTYFVCKPCMKSVKYEYSLSCFESGRKPSKQAKAA
jgi:hypothetical protein